MPKIPSSVLTSMLPMRRLFAPNAPRSSPGKPLEPFVTPRTSASTISPFLTFSKLPVSASKTAWPSAAEAFSFSVTNDSVPMPTVLSRTHAPIFALPSVPISGFTVNVCRRLFRSKTICALSGFAFNASCISSLVDTAVPLMLKITSPARNPARFAGQHSRPSLFRNEPLPTISSPRRLIDIPTARPPGFLVIYRHVCEFKKIKQTHRDPFCAERFVPRFRDIQCAFLPMRR